MKDEEASRAKRVVLRVECKTNLQYYRKVKGLSQRALAETAVVNLRTLQGYEQGRKNINKAGSAVVSRLAQALGVNVQDILEKTNDE